MASKVTRWRPDTCDCVLSYEWDDAVSEDERTHTPVKAELCAHHQALGTPVKGYEAVLVENQTTNRVRARLLQESALTRTRTDEGGSQIVEFDPSNEPTFEFTAQKDATGARRLRVSVAALSPAARSALQAEIDASTAIDGSVVIQ